MISLQQSSGKNPVVAAQKCTGLLVSVEKPAQIWEYLANETYCNEEHPVKLLLRIIVLLVVFVSVNASVAWARSNREICESIHRYKYTQSFYDCVDRFDKRDVERQDEEDRKMSRLRAGAWIAEKEVKVDEMTDERKITWSIYLKHYANRTYFVAQCVNGGPMNYAILWTTAVSTNKKYKTDLLIRFDKQPAKMTSWNVTDQGKITYLTESDDSVPALLADMAAYNTMKVRATTVFNEKQTDTFSLSGFSKAYAYFKKNSGCETP